MTLRKTLTIVMVAALAGWFANDAFTEDNEMPNEMEMWAKMMELGQPGEPHKLLGKLAGEWTADAKFYSSAGAMESAAASSNEMINGGRFLMTHYKGDIMGQPFEGRGFLGHDNLTKKYQMVWVDSMTSSIMFQEGTCSEDHKTITFEGTAGSPWGDFESKMVYTFKSDDEVVLESFGKKKGAAGDPMKEMTIVYKRKK